MKFSLKRPGMDPIVGNYTVFSRQREEEKYTTLKQNAHPCS